LVVVLVQTVTQSMPLPEIEKNIICFFNVMGCIPAKTCRMKKAAIET